MNLYGSSIPSTGLTSACLLAATVGGTETTKAMTYPSGTGKNYVEIWSKGNTAYPSANVLAALPATPLGNGWVYTPGAGSFATGNWTASANFAFTANLAANSNMTMRFFKYASSVYTAIGNIPGTIANIGSTAKQSVTFNAVSLASMSFLSTDLLYVDIWLYDPVGPGGDDPTVYESSSSSNGVAGDIAIVTPAFGAGTTRRYIRHKAFGRLR